MEIVGYHGTCSKYQDSIEKDGLDPDKSKYRSDHWLGQGVYFFDDYEKAKWWATSISSKNGNCGTVIYQAHIEAPDDKVLDLDIKGQLDIFMTELIRMFPQIKEECQGEMPIFDERNMRAVLFDYYKKTHDIWVIIYSFEKEKAGYTQKRCKDDLELQKKIMNIIKVRYKEKQICVSKKDCIKSFEAVDNDGMVDNDEEVI